MEVLCVFTEKDFIKVFLFPAVHLNFITVCTLHITLRRIMVFKWFFLCVCLMKYDFMKWYEVFCVENISFAIVCLSCKCCVRLTCGCQAIIRQVDQPYAAEVEMCAGTSARCVSILSWIVFPAVTIFSTILPPNSSYATLRQWFTNCFGTGTPWG